MFLLRIVAIFISGIVVSVLDVQPIAVVEVSLIVGLMLCSFRKLLHSTTFAVLLYVFVFDLAYIIALNDKCDVSENNVWGETAIVKEESQMRSLFGFISGRIDSTDLTQEGQALVHGMLLGDKSYMTKQNKQSIRDAGMSHIMAVSGMHIAILYLVFFWIFKPLRFMRQHKLHRICIVCSIWVYVLMIGAPASAVRATLMITIAVCGWIIERETFGMNTVMSAALIMLLYDTRLLFDAGFQLSFLAALGITIIKPVLQHKRKIEQLLLVAVSAQIITMPVVAYYFHFVPLFGWLQGLLVVPVLPFFVYLAIACVCFPSFSVFSMPVSWIAEWIMTVSQNISAIETWCLGGKILWHPSLIETTFLELLAILSLFLFRRELSSACRKNILAS